MGMVFEPLSAMDLKDNAVLVQKIQALKNNNFLTLSITSKFLPCSRKHSTANTYVHFKLV